jgi:hypothetical protein
LSFLRSAVGRAYPVERDFSIGFPSSPSSS